MIIGLGSQSPVKQNAVRAAMQHFNVLAELRAVKASSGVAEQPLDEETLLGAHNRAQHAAELVAEADFTIAIESGIFRRGDAYVDVAVVVARLRSGEFVSVESEAVEFPVEAVRETISRGTDKWTCGKVMSEWGLVAQHDDPHLSLSGTSRADYIEDATVNLFQLLRERGVL